ncbi:hypothetical protein ACP70R_012268 [Stipagrostis hirtigluma subsp. patula]
MKKLDLPLGNGEHEGQSMRSCAWNPNGKILAVGGCNSTNTLWKYKDSSFTALETIQVSYDDEIKSLME